MTEGLDALRDVQSTLSEVIRAGEENEDLRELVVWLTYSPRIFTKPQDPDGRDLSRVWGEVIEWNDRRRVVEPEPENHGLTIEDLLQLPVGKRVRFTEPGRVKSVAGLLTREKVDWVQHFSNGLDQVVTSGAVWNTLNKGWTVEILED